MSRRRWTATLALALAAALAAGACSSGGSKGSGSGAAQSSKPLRIGISLSFSGDFSDPAKLVRRGYELWADGVNARGGLLGRKVELKVVDDASSPTQVVSNYQNLITRDKVDLVFGPFSSLLTIPSARIANRYGYAFPEPEGGGPKVFAAKLPNLFFVQPAPALSSGDVFARYVLSLPAAERPKTAAYPSLDDPFASPIADRVRERFEAAGIRTVYKTIYPAETVDLTPIIQRVAAAKPDVVVSGTQSEDAYAQVKAMIQLGFSPKMLFMSNGANSPVEFPDKVGKGNTEGIFSSGTWSPDAKTNGNAEFVAAYAKKYGGGPRDIDGNTADAYATGQLLEEVAAKTRSLDNTTIIKTLHTGSWPTIQGELSWDADGATRGSDLLLQWIGGSLYPVYPQSVATHAPVSHKGAWRH
ncbi:MAG TPA: amino acid ABC transporter substrate-binding protein [Actinomycetota bacterium]|nr:amino acid ABC transporter substrate-binding protein [Actinomycetota bacterium]